MTALKIAVIGGSTYIPELIEGFSRCYDERPVAECAPRAQVRRLVVPFALT